jgi:hypothetical protein
LETAILPLNYARKRPPQTPPKEGLSEANYYLLKELLKNKVPKLAA